MFYKGKNKYPTNNIHFVRRKFKPGTGSHIVWEIANTHNNGPVFTELTQNIRVLNVGESFVFLHS